MEVTQGGTTAEAKVKPLCVESLILVCLPRGFTKNKNSVGNSSGGQNGKSYKRQNIGAIPASSSVKYPAKNETRTSCLNICLNPMAMTRIPKSVYYCLFSSAFALYQRHHVTSSDSFFSLETLRMFCLFANILCSSICGSTNKLFSPCHE